MLERTFQRWQQKPLWLREEQVGHLFRNRPDLEPAEQARLAALPVAVRKALAVQRMLQLVTEPAIARLAGTCEIDADELIVGSLPPFSVGQGKEFVRYLTEAEEYQGMLDFLNELSPMGHIVPDHGRVVNRGLRAIIGECEQLRTEAPEKTAFYDSVIICLQAVIDYARRMADHVRTKCEQLDATDPRRAHLTAIAERLHRVPAEPAVLSPMRSKPFTWCIAPCTGRWRWCRWAASTRYCSRSTRPTRRRASARAGAGVDGLLLAQAR
ncbi:hypothetical protein MUN79_29260 (plasmid) [Hymenobacter cellulosilyticus]|uniref:PFL domain-containing protein n=1 Tax=Hymenobacter cellulosilyticus TaxID=2932248 RepID=A0A8T9QEK3_9BACT|nr:pyruvate formate lyase family protein [Hymenobacter cellulosilyticus]UOQ75282.1 hypothetical protein MUN79_29260 [Hymenobacter cellulosilyticus]